MVHTAYILGNLGLQETDFVMQHDDTPCTQPATLPFVGGGMKVLEGSTTVLCIDGVVSINEGLYKQTCQGCGGALVPAAVHRVH
jgi:hypothetical protein